MFTTAGCREEDLGFYPRWLGWTGDEVPEASDAGDESTAAAVEGERASWFGWSRSGMSRGDRHLGEKGPRGPCGCVGAAPTRRIQTSSPWATDTQASEDGSAERCSRAAPELDSGCRTGATDRTPLHISSSQRGLQPLHFICTDAPAVCPSKSHAKRNE